MKVLGMGVPELVIILVVVLLIFGPKNLPKLGSAVGKTVKNLRDGMSDGKKEAVADEEEAAEEEEAASVKVLESSEEGEEEAPKKKRVVKKKVSA